MHLVLFLVEDHSDDLLSSEGCLYLRTPLFFSLRGFFNSKLYFKKFTRPARAINTKINLKATVNFSLIAEFRSTREFYPFYRSFDSTDLT